MRAESLTEQFQLLQQKQYKLREKSPLVPCALWQTGCDRFWSPHEHTRTLRSHPNVCSLKIHPLKNPLLTQSSPLSLASLLQVPVFASSLPSLTPVSAPELCFPGLCCWDVVGEDLRAQKNPCPWAEEVLLECQGCGLLFACLLWGAQLPGWWEL